MGTVIYNVVCPGCKKPMREGICMDDDDRDPVSGDFIACNHCLTMGRFDEHMEVRPLMMPDLENLPIFDMIKGFVIIQMQEDQTEH